MNIKPIACILVMTFLLSIIAGSVSVKAETPSGAEIHSILSGSSELGSIPISVVAPTSGSGGLPTFADVPPSHWAYVYIEALYQAGYIEGCNLEPRQYCPENLLSRSEMAVFIERGAHGANYTAPQPNEQTFSDVALTDWDAKWATALYIDGFTSGCGTNPLIFCSSRMHARSEAPVYFERMYHGKDFLPTSHSIQYYSDVPIGDDAPWFSKWIYAAFDDQLIQECEDEANRADDFYRPLEGLTRAEAACIMAKGKGLSIIPQGGTIVESSIADPVTLNPILSADSTSSSVHSKLFLSLLRLDEFSGEVIGEIADGWTVSQDGLTYTFNLRRCISWTDGHPVTAHDVKFTYDAIVSVNVDSPRRDILELVESINVIDDYTLQIVFHTLDCTALQNFILGILPEHMYAADFSDIMNSPLNLKPTVTNGPFQFKEWVRNDHITLVRNMNYYLGKPNIGEWTLRILSGASAEFAAFLAGEIDFIEVEPEDVSAIEVEIIKGKPFSIKKLFDDGYSYLGLNMGDPNNPEIGWVDSNNDVVFDEGEAPNLDQAKHPILSDKLVRQAIAYSIDYTDLINKVAFGQGATVAANVLPSIKWAYNVELKPYVRDFEKAGSLLDQAGWIDSDNDGVREKDGKPLALSIMTNLGNKAREAMAAIIKEDLETVGFDITLQLEEWGTMVGNLLGQQYDMVIIGWIGLGADPDDSVFWAYRYDDPGSGFNFISYYNEDVDKKLFQAKSLPGCSAAERGRLYKEIQALIHEDAPSAFLYVPLNNVAWNTRVKEINPGAWSIYYNIEQWYIDP